MNLLSRESGRMDRLANEQSIGIIGGIGAMKY